MKKFTKIMSLACCALFAGASLANAEDYVWKYVNTGDATTYAVRNDGSLWAWGWNELGQAGNGIKERSAMPTLTNGDLKWKKVAGGKAYAFFLAEDGSLWAAGSAESGIQGTGDGIGHKVLTRIGTDNNWVDVACTRFWGYTAFAIKSDGTLWGWGQNTSAQLGIGNIQTQIVPVQIGTDTDWKQVAVGSSSVIAIKNDGSLWGWGGNMRGEVFGYKGRQATPVRLGNANDWSYVCMIDYRAYGVKNDGTMWAWGDNSANLLGLNTETDEEGVVTVSQVTEPTQVTAITGNVISISGCENTMSVSTGTDGIIDKVWMFGSNTDGALGDGKGLGNGNTGIPFMTTPVSPSLKSSLKMDYVASGQNYTMVVTTDGDIWGWGCNRGGQLGDETLYDQLQTAYKLKPTLINCPQDEITTSISDAVAQDTEISINGSVVSLQTEGRLTSATIYNLQGAAVMILSASESSWNISSLPQGTYIAKFVVDGKAFTSKFAK